MYFTLFYDQNLLVAFTLVIHFCSTENSIGFLVDKWIVTKKKNVFFLYTPFVPPNNKMDFTLHTQYTVLHTQCDFKKFLWNTSMATRKNNGGSHTAYIYANTHTHNGAPWNGKSSSIERRVLLQNEIRECSGGKTLWQVLCECVRLTFFCFNTFFLLTEWLMSLWFNSSSSTYTSIGMRDEACECVCVCVKYITILQAKNCFDLFWCGHKQYVRHVASRWDAIVDGDSSVDANDCDYVCLYVNVCANQISSNVNSELRVCMCVDSSRWRTDFERQFHAGFFFRRSFARSFVRIAPTRNNN